MKKKKLLAMAVLLTAANAVSYAADTESIMEKIQSNTSAVNGLADRVQPLEEKVAENTGLINDHAVRLGRIEENRAADKRAIQEINNKLGNTNDYDHTTLELDIATLQGKVQDNKADIKRALGNISGIDTYTKTNRNKIETLEDTKAYVDLRNINGEGETVIQNIAKTSVALVAGKDIKVSSREVVGNMVWTVEANVEDIRKTANDALQIAEENTESLNTIQGTVEDMNNTLGDMDVSMQATKANIETLKGKADRILEKQGQNAETLAAHGEAIEKLKDLDSKFKLTMTALNAASNKHNKAQDQAFTEKLNQLQATAKDAVKIAAGDNISVSSSDVNGKTEWTVNADLTPALNKAQAAADAAEDNRLNIETQGRTLEVVKGDIQFLKEGDQLLQNEMNERSKIIAANEKAIKDFKYEQEQQNRDIDLNKKRIESVSDKSDRLTGILDQRINDAKAETTALGKDLRKKVQDVKGDVRNNSLLINTVKSELKDEIDGNDAALRSDIERIDENAAITKRTVDSLEKKQNKTTGTVANLGAQVADLKAADTANKEKIAENAGAVQTNRGQIDLNTKHIGEIKGKFNDMDVYKANTDLDNLSDEGKNIAKDLAKEAVTLEDGLHTTVSSRTVNNNEIWKVNVDLSKVEKGIKENKANIEANGQAITDNQGAIQVNAEAIVKANEKIGENATAITTNAEGVKANKEAIANNAAAIAKNAEDIVKANNGIAENKTAITANAEGVKENKETLADVTLRVGNAENTVADHTSQIGAAEKRLNDMETEVNRIDDIKDSLLDMERDVEDNTAAIAENAKAIKGNTASIETNTTAIGENTTAVKANTAAIEKNTEAIAKNVEDIVKANDGIAENKTAITTNAEGVKENKETLADVTLRVDNAENTVADHTAQIGAAEKRLNDMETEVNRIDDINDSLLDMERDVEDNTAAIAENAKAIKGNTASIETNTTAIGENTTAVKANTAAIENNTEAIAKNVEDIVKANDSIAENKTAITTNTEGVKANKEAVATNAASIAKNAEDIVKANDSIAENKTAITTNAEGVKANKEAIANNATAIAKNAEDIVKANNGIAENKTAITTNAEGVKANKEATATNATAIAKNAEDIVKANDGIAENKTAITTNAEGVQANKEAVEASGTRLTEVENLAKDQGERLDLVSSAVEDIFNGIGIGGLTEMGEDLGSKHEENAERIQENALQIQNNSEAITRNGERIESNANAIAGLDKKMKHQGSLSAALAGLHAQEFDSEHKTQILAGVGYYSGNCSVALGVARMVNDTMTVQAGLAFDGGNKAMSNLGFSWKVGKGSCETRVSCKDHKKVVDANVQLQSDMEILKADFAKLQEHNVAVEAENQAMKEANAKMQEQIEMLMKYVGMTK